MCKIEGSIIGNEVTFGNDVLVEKNSIIGDGVTIPSNTVIEKGSVVMSERPTKEIEKGSDGKVNWKILCEEKNGIFCKL
jgi:acetyltransferase-like isoleucine patch superfamily enzyme